MRIGAVGFQIYQPYIYNTNTVRGNSLSKVKPISDDLLSSKTDFSGMTDEEQQNLNPLRRGETVNFADVIAMQMQMGRMNADKIMRPAEKTVAATEVSVSGLDSRRVAEDADIKAERVMDAEGEDRVAEDGESTRLMQTGASLYQMQHAAFAYQMNMIA